MSLWEAPEVSRLRPDCAKWTDPDFHRMFVAGDRTGTFRLGTDQLLVDANGKSSISYEDYAVALVDELEQPKHLRRRFTVGY
jgi:uncharacterized protein